MTVGVRVRVAIIGAGPAGLTAAHALQTAGIEVEVFEAAPQVGGLARSIDLWGHKVDLGPHRFFSQNARVNDFWHRIAGEDFCTVNRRTRIFYRKKFFDYPLAVRNVLANLPATDIAAAILSWTKAQCGRRQDTRTFESWVVRRFGRHLYKMFFKSYTEKLWGIPCTALDADFATQRIRGFSLGGIIAGALPFGKGKHRTLVDRFDYPTGGCGAVYETMAREIVARGGKIHLRAPVRRVLADGRMVTGLELADGTMRAFSHVVSTMPLTLMAAQLPAVPADVSRAIAELRYRNTILVFLRVEASDLFPDQWIYVHEPAVDVGRITNFRNWAAALYGNMTSTILALEYWCNNEDDIWALPDDALIVKAAAELRQIGLIGTAEVTAGHVERIGRSYPVYAAGYRDALACVTDFLKSFNNLLPIGRYGAFKYNNQDHSIYMGLLAAENIANGAAHDLWSVNSDYDKYQEDQSPPRR
jgi:protoporphyrinogen oxidase